MSDLRELYQQVIIDHSKNPRNFKTMGECTCSMDGHNPLCGDKLTVFIKMDGDTLKDL
ncbi:iron-sulfur cluster assembly scaffold protein, partial [bacterium]|nr:iron-sulfur cluster assembly scaffold protein [bacterium]